MVLYIFFFPENINLWGEKVQIPLTLVDFFYKKKPGLFMKSLIVFLIFLKNINKYI